MPTKEELETQLEKARKDIENLARMAGDRAGAAADQMETQIDAYVNDLSDEARELFESARSQGAALRVTAEDHIKQNPLAAVAIALGAGVLLASLFRR